MTPNQGQAIRNKYVDPTVTFTQNKSMKDKEVNIL